MANPIILPSRSAKRRGQADPRATAADIAQAAGVSTATVSRALQENSIVSVETREKVLAAARRLGYRPNSLARSLAAGQNSLIGVVTGDITNPFYPEVIERLTRRLTSAGLHPILVNMFDDNAFEDTLSSVLQYRVKAVIFTASPLTSTACELCEDYDVPLYLFNRHLASGDSFAVVCNNLAGGRMVAALLLDNGHSNLAYISGRPDTSTNQERHAGFAKMIAERGAVPCIIEHGGVYSYEAGYKAAIRLVQAHPEVDGIFCANDILALGALDALRYELGKHVPRDISVIGFDDIAPAAWPAYNLTTIRQPVDQMIEAVVSAIQRVNVEDPLTPGSPAVLDGELVIRGSARLEPRSGQEAAHDAA
jgi:DNA-binding LacI/PurR family transcriptional regulator